MFGLDYFEIGILLIFALVVNAMFFGVLSRIWAIVLHYINMAIGCKNRLSDYADSFIFYKGEDITDDEKKEMNSRRKRKKLSMAFVMVIFTFAVYAQSGYNMNDDLKKMDWYTDIYHEFYPSTVSAQSTSKVEKKTTNIDKDTLIALVHTVDFNNIEGRDIVAIKESAPLYSNNVYKKEEGNYDSDCDILFFIQPWTINQEKMILCYNAYGENFYVALNDLEKVGIASAKKSVNFRKDPDGEILGTFKKDERMEILIPNYISDWTLVRHDNMIGVVWTSLINYDGLMYE